MGKEVNLSKQISDPNRTQEITVLGLRFSPNAHVEEVRRNFKKELVHKSKS